MSSTVEQVKAAYLERFRAHLAERRLIPPGSRVLIGYSGGADSTCLLHLLVWAGIDTTAAYLHHGQRAEADDELLNCEQVCVGLGVPFLSGRADVPEIARTRRVGIEEAGRIARYEFFRLASRQAQCGLIATAHTRTDLAETVLLNLARGCGLGGLVGVPERRGQIVRPLLGFTREETLEFCRELGVWTHEDPSNLDLTFSRARIRHRVLPELEALNPAYQAAIARLAGLAGEEDRFLDGAAAAALEGAEIPLNGELRFLTLDSEAAFDRSRLLHLPEVLFRRALRLSAEALGGDWDFAQTSAIAAACRTQEKGSFTAEGGKVVLEWDAIQVHVRSLEEIETFRFPLTVPGETISESFGWRFAAAEADGSGGQNRRSGFSVDLDQSRLSGALYFRSPQHGDKMQPLGFQSERRLSDLLSEAKLTRAARRRLPIVCDMIGPIWVPGVCVSERAAAKPASSSGSETSKGRKRTIESTFDVQNVSCKALRLRFEPLGAGHGETDPTSGT